MKQIDIKTGSYKSIKQSRKIADIASMIMVVIMAAAVMLPIWWILRSALMTNAELYKYPPDFLPPKWRFYNFVETLEYFRFWLYLKNTMTIIVPSVIGGTITATICGYAFGRLEFKGKKFIFSLCVGSMLLPNMVTLVPLYIMWSRVFGWADTYWPLILPHFTGGGAFSIFLIRQFIKTIPRELDEAAKIDGAGYMRILWSILVPSIRSAMIVVALLLFISLWNDMLQQLVYINTPDKFTIAIGLNLFRGALKADWSKLMAATCMSFTPGLVFYLIGQRYFIEGIVMTGLKS